MHLIAVFVLFVDGVYSRGGNGNTSVTLGERVQYQYQV